MIHGPADHSYGATAGCVILVTGAAFALIIYATLTFLGLLSSAPAQDLLQLVSY